MTRPVPATVLKRAKALLEDKWGKYSFYNPAEDTYCAWGALARTISKAKDNHEAAGLESDYLQEIVNKYLEPVLPEYSKSLISYNDKKETSKADILDLFDRAIALAEKKG